MFKEPEPTFLQKFKEPPNTVPNHIIPYCHKASFGVSVCKILRASITRSSKPRNSFTTLELLGLELVTKDVTKNSF
jgi:hypothetical protein